LTRVLTDDSLPPLLLDFICASQHEPPVSIRFKDDKSCYTACVTGPQLFGLCAECRVPRLPQQERGPRTTDCSSFKGSSKSEEGSFFLFRPGCSWRWIKCLAQWICCLSNKRTTAGVLQLIELLDSGFPPTRQRSVGPGEGRRRKPQQGSDALTQCNKKT